MGVVSARGLSGVWCFTPAENLDIRVTKALKVPHYRVLARLKRQGPAPCRFVRRPVVFPQHPVVFSVPCHFPRALWFLWRYFELEVAESIQLRRKVVRFSCMMLLFASDICAILDLRHRFRHESEATLMAFVGMSFSQLFTWKVVQGIWILIQCNEY